MTLLYYKQKLNDREQSVLSALQDGPKSLEELAEIVYGEPWTWPLTWQNCLASSISHIRKAGVGIGTKRVYYLE